MVSFSLVNQVQFARARGDGGGMNKKATGDPGTIEKGNC